MRGALFLLLVKCIEADGTKIIICFFRGIEIGLDESPVDVSEGKHIGKVISGNTKESYHRVENVFAWFRMMARVVWASTVHTIFAMHCHPIHETTRSQDTECRTFIMHMVVNQLNTMLRRFDHARGEHFGS